jgi:CRP-like cAMP-binding protein
MYDALSRVPLFDGLTQAQIARLARIASERLYGSGELIFRVGDPSEGLFIVLEGTVKITRSITDVGEETLAVLRTGQHFGEMSLIDDDATRSATATAHHRVRALLLPRRDLRDLMFVDRELAHDLLWRFVRRLTRRVRETNDRLAMLSGSSKF